MISKLIAISVATLALTFFTFATLPKTDEIKWETDFDEALKLAKKSPKKKMFILFTGSDWCGWCIKLNREVFLKEAFERYAQDNFIMVKLDFPRKSAQTEAEKARNTALAREYGVQGFPTVLIMDKDKKVLHVTGYLNGGPENYVKHLQESLKTR
ncbi:MAG: hypothetical protein OHK0053_15510 [Microscillaceae bacterium]